jgi:dihydrofolate reductase
MLLSLIAAMDRNRLIGNEGRLPWHLPADLAHFKRVTLGKPVLMGRRTFESIGRPLPGRHNIVVTTVPSFRALGCTVVHSVEEGIAAAGIAGELMVIGGAAIYAQCLPRADRMYLTLVDAPFEGDVFFPAYDPGEWREVERQDFAGDERNPYRYSFVTLERGKMGSGKMAGKMGSSSISGKMGSSRKMGSNSISLWRN